MINHAICIIWVGIFKNCPVGPGSAAQEQSVRVNPTLNVELGGGGVVFHCTGFPR